MDVATRLRLNLNKRKMAEGDESLTAMYNDIVKTFETQRQDKYRVEDQMLQLAIVFEKTRAAFVDLSAESKMLRKQNSTLTNELKTLQTKYRIARDSLYDEQQEKEQAQRELVEMESTLSLMKEIVFDNTENRIKLDANQRNRLVRACSIKRSNSTITTPRRAPMRKPTSDETFDETQMDNSDISFDETIDESFRVTNTFKTPRRGKRSVDTLKMDDTNLPDASSTICTSSDSCDSIAKKQKIRCEVASGNEMTTTVKGPAVMTVSQGANSGVKRRSGNNFLRPNGHAARRRQSRHHRQSAVIEEVEIEDENDTVEEKDTSTDSFFTPTGLHQKTGTIKARKILGANESQLSNDKIELDHRFTAKRCVTVETCRVCFRRIKFYQSCSKCATCRVIVHPECVPKLKITCGGNETPKTERIAIVGPRRLEDMLIDKQQKPKIPPPVYLAVHEIDQRLHEEGLYRISGSVKNLQEMKKKLLFGEVANVKWSEIDVHTLTSFVKDFFRVQLTEPLLTYKMLPLFIEAATHNYAEMMKKLFKKLPDTNRDTMAFVIVHLQNVVTNSEKNRMTTTALARSIGPSLIGFESATPSPEQIKRASGYQEKIMENLLMLPTQFYYGFIASGNINQSVGGNAI